MKLENIKKLQKVTLQELSQKTEFTIQVEIVNYCKKNKILCFSVPNEATRNNSKFFRSGVLPGVSDLIVVLPNKILFVEVKNYKGKQQTNQKEFELQINNLGFNYHIVRSLEDFVKIIT